MPIVTNKPPLQPPAQGQITSPILTQCLNLLTPLTTGAPGLLEALFLSAKVKFLSGNLVSTT